MAGQADMKATLDIVARPGHGHHEFGNAVGQSLTWRRSQVKASIRAITIYGCHQAGTRKAAHLCREGVGQHLAGLLQSRRLQVAQQLSEAETLARELLNFKGKVTQTAHESFGADRDHDHDDLVIAVALAAWQGEHLRKLDIWA